MYLKNVSYGPFGVSQEDFRTKSSVIEIILTRRRKISLKIGVQRKYVWASYDIHFAFSSCILYCVSLGKSVENIEIVGSRQCPIYHCHSSATGLSSLVYRMLKRKIEQ